MATKSIAWQTGGGSVTLIYQGQGDGTIDVSSDDNTLGSARSMTIAVHTTNGAITRNLTVNQAACPFPIGEVRNFQYTGEVQSVELPAGQYKLQCWGAQGGSNAADSSYGITAKAGGKGGYSEGILTLTSKTTVRIYVGGAGSSSAGGFNGGGSTTGSSTYNASNEQGVSRMGGGGGASDIRLSDGSLLSRMIVAGGGGGGAMCYRSKTTSQTTTINIQDSEFIDGVWVQDDGTVVSNSNRASTDHITLNSSTDVLKVNLSSGASGWNYLRVIYYDSSKTYVGYSTIDAYNGTVNHQPSEFNASYARFVRYASADYGSVTPPRPYIERTTSSTTSSTDSQVGYVGGGTTGGGYSSTYQGKQNAAGSGGSFGQGANQTATNYRYCSGAGGGGWYGGGGGQYSDSSMTTCKYSGGGSGFVNTADNAQYRPSGYTGLQLDSGTTYAGSSSFPSTSGGTETGHSGNGYARITRLSRTKKDNNYE